MEETVILEPSNSWEVSFVIHIRRPEKDIDVNEVVWHKVLGNPRMDELRKWAKESYNSKWFKDHI